MPHLKVYIHFVWSTKIRHQYLDSKELRLKVWCHMKENAIKNGIFIDFVNGYSEHCHCLISLNADQTIRAIMQQIKGESARWINKNAMSKQQFEWQDEYWGTSVSPSALKVVRNYIKNQEEHHAKNPDFKKELEEYKKQNNFTCFNSKNPPAEAGGN